MSAAGCEGEWWKCGRVLLSVTAGIRAIISSKRTRQIPRDSDRLNYLSESWQRPPERALRAHHSPYEEWVEAATVPSVFISPYHVLISPYKQAFRVCLLQRYLLVNFETVRSKNLHQRCPCYLQRLLLDPDHINKLNRKSCWHLGTKIFWVKQICVHCNLLMIYLISPYFRAAVNQFPLKIGHRWSCGAGGGGGCSWHYWGRSGISLACLFHALRVKPVTRLNSNKLMVW